MSFLHSIRGFGRSSKNKKKEEPGSHPSPLYQHANVSASGLRRSQSPTKSPQKSARYQVPTSPTKRTKPVGQRSPTRRSAQVSSRSPGGQVPPPLTQMSSQATLQTMPQTQVATKPVKEEAVPLFLCDPFVKAALVKGSFRTIIQLPKYVDIGEWLALNIFEMNAHLNSFYAVLSDVCTQERCPSMSAGSGTNYLWVDQQGQPVALPAPLYIDYVLTWINNKINDQSVFPTKSGGAFPPNFMKDCKNILRQMFRVFAHIYHSHFDTIVHLSIEAHWNSFFAHFISMVKELNLMDRSEFEPMLPLIENFMAQGKII